MRHKPLIKKHRSAPSCGVGNTAEQIIIIKVFCAKYQTPRPNQALHTCTSANTDLWTKLEPIWGFTVMKPAAWAVWLEDFWYDSHSARWPGHVVVMRRIPLISCAVRVELVAICPSWVWPSFCATIRMDIGKFSLHFHVHTWWAHVKFTWPVKTAARSHASCAQVFAQIIHTLSSVTL